MSISPASAGFLTIFTAAIIWKLLGKHPYFKMRDEIEKIRENKS
jgi:hypothetical protein